MNAEERANKLKQLDSYRRDFDLANTALAIKALPLRQAHTEEQQLKSFVAAGLELASVCEQPSSDTNPLDVLFWLDQSIQTESVKPCRDFAYRLACKQEIRHIHRRIKRFCQSLGQGNNIVPFLAP